MTLPVHHPSAGHLSGGRDPGGGVVTRWFPSSALLLVWPAMLVGFVSQSPSVGALALLAAPLVWVAAAAPWRIVVDIDQQVVHLDFLPFSRCRRSFDAGRLTFEATGKYLKLDLPTPVLRRRTVKVGRPITTKLEDALRAAGASHITGS